uniref:Uncharacterized protein n=1 Tax=Rhizophora mucronata TaxID=61149 RepID=A0A2P2PIC6_RHIMU
MIFQQQPMLATECWFACMLRYHNFSNSSQSSFSLCCSHIALRSLTFEISYNGKCGTLSHVI